MSTQSNKQESSLLPSNASPSNDVAILLDLDNLVIGAKQVNLNFDINLVLDHIKALTNGRVVLRNAYGDSRQDQQLIRQLATAGFTTRNAVRLNNFSKNLADMQIVVDTMETLLDGQNFRTYVLMTGDRDFTPLVQSLRKRGKQVIGLGVKHTTSQSLANLCDHYIYYEDIVPVPQMNEAQVRELLEDSLQQLLNNEERVRASVLKQRMSDSSKGAFDKSTFAEGSFRKFLEKHPDLVRVEQEETTIYIKSPETQEKPATPLHIRYRRELKKRRMRVVEREMRFSILKDLVNNLATTEQIRWRELIDGMAEDYKKDGRKISKNAINAVLLVARQAQVIHTLKDKSLSTAPVLLEIKGAKAYQEAVMRCDAVYVKEILDLPEEFDEAEAALSLYYEQRYSNYIKTLIKNFARFGM
ncbi:MAG: NYN domain-containing protein [Ardenticatenaceae bacterium]|nr:NYN domain-containing protein [Anaerolineales bacterium]MCB8938770.1 NYN domain-containing protein [Ardenticatenaceae bacterium]MCB8974006.1 NYN domain-containing protein [Ardenticatenaceae bacterium]